MADTAPDTPLPYARDLRGYGPQIPHARWPGEARVADVNGNAGGNELGIARLERQ